VRLTAALFTIAILGAAAVLAADDTNKESLSYGCSGGFTGGGSGIVVYRDGEFQRWSKPTYRDPVEQSSVRSDRAAAGSLFAELERISFTSIRYHKVDNMTCSLTLRREGSTHAVAWPMGDPATPAEVVALVARMEQLAGAQPTGGPR
jgi:hypothetical protein